MNRLKCVLIRLLWFACALCTKAWAIDQPLVDSQTIEVGRFSSMQIHDWQEKSFFGNTQYQLTKAHNKYVLQATANNSASALYKSVNINLYKTPYLNWSWAVVSALPELNEQTKPGDDYAARIYVVVKTGLAPWKKRALNYVWSSNKAPLESWPNVFTNKAIMIPLRAGKDSAGIWQMEKVNVLKDIKKYLRINVEKIEAIAIMTDTDNSGKFSVAQYGDLYFSSH